MGCCGDGNKQKNVKEWGNDQQSKGNINIKFIIVGVILLGVVLYKFLIWLCYRHPSRGGGNKLLWRID